MKFKLRRGKFEERLVDQRKAKRNTVMVDFHDMPKTVEDSRAPRKYWWSRN